MTGAGWGGWGNATAAPGSNPFPGAVAGVYEVSDPPTFVERVSGAVDIVQNGPLWLSVGGNSWARLIAFPVSDVTELPVAQPEEYFTIACIVTDNAGNIWRGNGETGWVRIVCAAVASAAALPNPYGDETFAADLLCLTADLGIVYKWDGAGWGLV